MGMFGASKKAGKSADAPRSLKDYMEGAEESDKAYRQSMSAFALWRYTRHLASNAQAAQRYEIQFWKKSFYPLVCFVMIALALPFAYLHARSGSMSLKIFGGIMLGISFVLINHISSHLGLLQNWQPWLAAAAPSLLYLLLSMSVFAWLVRYQ